MNRFSCTSLVVALVACLALAGCAESDPEPRAPSTDSGHTGTTSRVNMGQNIWLEKGADGKRRILISAQVCLTHGQLEHFLTISKKKEHEAIFAADIDARSLRLALEGIQAKVGTPVRFDPSFRPPTGTRVVVSVRFTENGATRTVPARSLVRNVRTKEELETDWVFAGSILMDDPFNPKGPKTFLANQGDVIAVVNIESALLDLPIPSAMALADRTYEAWTERIPKEGTKATIVLEPQLPAPK